jgi:hypothetical protein
LIDECRLVVHPVALSAGERLFPVPLDIEPMNTTAFSSGAVAHVLRGPPAIKLTGNRAATSTDAHRQSVRKPRTVHRFSILFIGKVFTKP